MNSPNLPRPRRRTAVAPAALVATTLCLLPLSLPAAPPPGQLLASQCAQCHGTNGQAVSGFESIRGKSASDMFKTLVEMKNRPAETIMDRQARGYTDDQLRFIAAYLAALPATNP